MAWIKESAMALAAASDGSPVMSTLTVMLFYVMFNLVEAQIEKVFFGERFEHWLDPIFGLAFISYSAYAVWACAKFNSLGRG